MRYQNKKEKSICFQTLSARQVTIINKRLVSQ